MGDPRTAGAWRTMPRLLACAWLIWAAAANAAPAGGPAPAAADPASSGGAMPIGTDGVPASESRSAVVEAVRAALPDPPVPADAVRNLLYARPIVLDEPFVYTFLHDQPAITRGMLLVLSVDPEAARPREVDVPVLYGGDTPVHFTNTGFPSGRLVILVPDWVDLARDPFYFGSTELPERVDRSRGGAERALAMERGALPFDLEQRTAALAAGGAPLHCADSVALFRAVADLIDRFAPDEGDRARNYRTPVVGR